MARIKYYDSSTRSWQYADEFGTAGLTPYGIGAIPAPEVAEVGQTVVVKSVDENGKPTEWEMVDLPSGGGDTLKLIKTIKLTEEVSTIKINTDDNGNPLNLKRIVVVAKTIGGTNNANKSNYWYHPGSVNAGAIRGTVSQGVYATNAAVVSIVDVQMITKGSYLLYDACNNTNVHQSWGSYNNEPAIKELNLGISTTDYTFGVNSLFYVMGVRA